MAKQNKPDLKPVADAICSKHGYRLSSFLGGGAFKQVFLGEGNSGTVAVKVVDGPASQPRTAREMDALSRCNHRGVPVTQLVDRIDFADKSFDYQIEEFLGGGTLTERMAQTCTLSVDEVSALGESLISIVGHIWSLGLVHRDIKPDNIMFREGETEPVLVDFGLVRDVNAASLTQSWMMSGPGTPYFASPEQLNNQKRLIDWRADQFAIGVVMSICCWGIHPYQSMDEEYGALATVQRVANRGQRSKQFIDYCHETGLALIEQMTRPWAAQRFRNPGQISTSR